MMQKILDYCESQADWLFETIEALVCLESPSTDKVAVDRCGDELVKRLIELGGTVERLPREKFGDIVRAEFGEGSTQVLLLGHFDTVWPVGQIARMPFRLESGRLYGPGVFDMKAGIAVGMLAVRALQELGFSRDKKIVMLWTTDEELGSDVSRLSIEDEAKHSSVAFVLEPGLPGGAVKTGRKGCGEFELVVEGVAAHAGIEPGKGASAIHELVRLIGAVRALHDLERGISVNVGTISGGTRSNVVAESARATIDLRAPTIADMEALESAFHNLSAEIQGTALSVTGGFSRPPLERSEGVVKLYEQARVIAAEINLELREGSTGGGSDGNFTAALGIPTLDGLGAVGDGAHALHEHVEVTHLPWRATLIAGLIERSPGVSLSNSANT